MRTLATLLFSLAAMATAVQAQDLPSRVGRVAFIEGRVSLYQDPDAGWEQAYVNSPITSENSVWADDGGRAEVRISGIALRLDQYTQLDLARLLDQELDAFVARGSVAIRVRHAEPGERLVFHTQNTNIQLGGDGRYRIDFDPDRIETRVTVFTGEARLGDGRMVVAAGRSVLVFGEQPQFVEERAATDNFDRWVATRDERWIERGSTTYVSSYMTGYEDLDGAGQWAQEPDYGTIWYPSRVAADWAPYRYGHWDYVPPWGWTWIDDASWGYAPFHYGRWVYAGNRWGWIPGQRVARPVWAPALVAWVGGSGLSVGVSSGPSVGWYPLSPWDTYQPWFRASPAYVNHVNVIVRNPPHDQRYREWHQFTRDRGTTVVERRALVERQPIARAALRVNSEAVRRAQPVQQPTSVLPSRQDWVSRRRDEPRQNIAAPVVSQQQLAGRPQGGQRQNQATPQAAPERNVVVRPDFARRGNSAAPQRATPEAQQAQERAQREARQQQERAQRDAQQRPPQQQPQQPQAQQPPQQNPLQRQTQDRASQEARQAQERAQKEAQQQQERAQKEAQQQQQGRAQQEARQQQERAQKEAQQQQERAQKEAQQQQQGRAQQEARQQQERAQKEAQQQQERAQKESQQQQQQQQRQAQERAQKEAQQQQQRAQKEAQQQQERAQREAQQQQQRAQQEAQQQQQRQAQEKAQREAQQQQQRAQQEARQAQERAQHEAQQQQQRQQQQQQQQRAREEKQKEKDEKDKDKDNDKGRGGKTQPQ